MGDRCRSSPGTNDINGTKGINGDQKNGRKTTESGLDHRVGWVG